MPFAMHGAQELAAQRTPDLAMAGPVEGIELHQHRDRADETGGVGYGRDLARGVLRHEVERDRIDEEGLKGYVQIAKQRHHLIERRVALVQHGIADGLQRLHAGEIEQTDPERQGLGIALERGICGAGDAGRGQNCRSFPTPAHDWSFPRYFAPFGYTIARRGQIGAAGRSLRRRAKSPALTPP